jgi:hypothetical protein
MSLNCKVSSFTATTKQDMNNGANIGQKSQVFLNSSQICKALKQIVQQCEQNTIPMSFMITNADFSKSSLEELDSSFMYTHKF